MDRELLDQLIVPAPPYRMTRPRVLLAAEGPSEPPTPPPIEKATSPAKESLDGLEGAQTIERAQEQEAVIEAAQQQEEAKLDAATPPAGATPEEAAEDAANKEEAKFKVREAAAEGGAEVRQEAERKYETLEDYEAELARLNRIADEARAAGETKKAAVALRGVMYLGPRVEEMRRQAPPKPAPVPEPAPVSVPAAEALRPPTLNEQVSALSREAQEELNKFQAAPTAEARAGVQEAQRKLKAAKLGEPEGFDPDKFAVIRDSDDVRRARAAAEEELQRQAQAAPAPEAPVSPQAEEEPSPIIELSEGERRQIKFAGKTPQQKASQIGIDMNSAKREDAARTAAKEAEQQQRDQERATSEGMPPVPEVGSETVYIKPEKPSKQRRRAARAAANAPVAPEGLDTSRLRPADEEIPPAAVGRQTTEETAPPAVEPKPKIKFKSQDELERYVNMVQGKPSGPEAEQTPSSPEQTIADLQQRIAQLEARLAQPRAVTPPEAGGKNRGGEQPPGGPPEEGAKAGPEEEGPYEEEPAEPADIEDLGTEEGLSFFEKWALEREAGNKDWKAVLSQGFAQWASNSVEARNKKIKEWEKRGAASAKKGLFGTAKSILWDEAWGNWHKFWGRRAYNAWEGWDNARVVAENTRDELLNQGAARIDKALKSFEARADQDAVLRDDEETALEAAHEQHKSLTTLLAESTGEERNQIAQKLADLEADMKERAIKKSEHETAWKRNRKQAAQQRKRKQSLLTYALRPARVSTTPVEVSKYDWLPTQQRKTRPGGSPPASARAKAVAAKRLRKP